MSEQTLVERLRNVARASFEANRTAGRRGEEWALEAEPTWQAATALEAQAAEIERLSGWLRARTQPYPADENDIGVALHALRDWPSQQGGTWGNHKRGAQDLMEHVAGLLESTASRASEAEGLLRRAWPLLCGRDDLNCEREGDAICCQSRATGGGE